MKSEERWKAMRKERLTPRDIAILASVVVLAVCCVCGGLAITFIGDVGYILTAPLRWLDQLLSGGDGEPEFYGLSAFHPPTNLVL
jgi:hypothetical protein